MLQLTLQNAQFWESEAVQQWLRRHQHPTPARNGAVEGPIVLHQSKFAPSAIRALASANPNAHSVPWRFRWTHAFRAFLGYTLASDPASMASAPTTIVNAEEDWTYMAGSPLLGLAWACVEAAVERGDDWQRQMARLVKELVDAFEQKNWVLASAFREMLKRCVWEESEAWWNPVRCVVLLSVRSGTRLSTDILLP